MQRIGYIVPTTITLPTDASPGPRAYRAFLLGCNGRIRSSQMIEAATDDEAQSLAARIVNAFGVDLWERARHLASFPPLSMAGSEG